MAVLALSDLLQDFGKRPPLAAQAAAGIPKPAAVASRSHATSELDLAAMIAAEVARAEAALEQRLAQEHEAALAAQREHHATEIEMLHQRYGGEAAGLIDTGIAAMEERICALATTGAARLISGLLTQDLQKRALESLAGSIRAAIADRDAIRIRVSGPQSLFAELAATLPERAGNFDYAEAPGFDLTVTIDGDIFETRLSEWSVALSEILS